MSDQTLTYTREEIRELIKDTIVERLRVNVSVTVPTDTEKRVRISLFFDGEEFDADGDTG